MAGGSGQVEQAPVIAASDPDVIALAASILLRGGVLAIPTDTVYGFAAALAFEAALARLYAMKGRPESKAIPVLLSDPGQIGRVAGDLLPSASSLACKFLARAVDDRSQRHGKPADSRYIS